MTFLPNFLVRCSFQRHAYDVLLVATFAELLFFYVFQLCTAHLFFGLREANFLKKKAPTRIERAAACHLGILPSCCIMKAGVEHMTQTYARLCSSESMAHTKAILLLLCVALSCTNIGSAESLHDFLFSSNAVPPDLTDSVRLANKEKQHVLSVMRETEGLALVLPSNAAWRANPGLYDAIYNGDTDIRQDILLSSAVDVPVTESSSWDRIKRRAQQNGGVIDTAYGTSYIVRDSADGTRGMVCIAEWENGGYQARRCTELLLPPTILSDATVYRTDQLILPDDLQQALSGLL